MKRRNLRWLVGLLLTMVTGLVGLTPPPPLQAQTQAVDGEFIYLLEDNTAGNRIHGYRFNAATGLFTSLGTPVETGYVGSGNPNDSVQRLAYHMATHRLFAINSGIGSNVLSVYQVDMLSGALTEEMTVSLGDGSWECVAIHPSGSPVLIGGGVESESGTIGRMQSLIIDANGMHQAPGSPADAGAAIPSSCSFSQDGQYIYAGGYSPSDFAGFHVNAIDGAITPLAGSPFNSNIYYPSSYATDDQGRLFTSISWGSSGQLNVFTTTNGIPTQVSGGPFNMNQDLALDGLWHPDGYYIVATLSGLKIYQVNGSGSDTTLVALNSPEFPSEPWGPLALNQNGEWLFASNFIGDVFSLQLNSANGTLNWMGLTHAYVLISGMVYASAPPPPPVAHGHLYVLRDVAEDNLIYGYQVDRITGRLTLLDGFPISTGGEGAASLKAKQLDFDPIYNRLYALNDGSDTISVFDVNHSDGTLSPIPGSPFALESGMWNCVQVSPLGSPVVVVASNKLISFQANADSLTPASATATTISGIIGEECVFDLNGEFLYLTGSDIGVYRVNDSDGTLSMLPGSPFYSGVIVSAFGLEVDSENRLLLGEWRRTTEGTITANHIFTLADGQPIAVTGNPFSWQIGSYPVDATYHPAGYYIIGNEFGMDTYGSTLDVFRMHGSGATSSFTFISSTPPDQPPLPFSAGVTGLRTLTLDHTGQMLFVANEQMGLLTSFRFDPATGMLQGLSTLSPGSLGGTSIQINGLAYAKIHRVFLPLIHTYTAKKPHSK